MSEDQDDSQKTEEPTRKRLEEAAERGQSVSSRELTSFLILFAFTMVMTSLAPGILHKSQAAISMFIERPDTIIIDNKESIGNLMLQVIKDCASILFIPFTLFVVAVIGSSILQNNFIFSIEPIIPKLEKISVMKGISRLFSMRSLVEFGKSIIKILLVSFVAYYAILPYFMHLKQLPSVSIDGIISYLAITSKKMMIGICIAMFFIAVIDYMYQRFEFMKSLRMTKQELKDEYRQQEGDPLVKQKIRQLRIERSRKRMMAAVPTADVIITNPTHYSIALKYDASMTAPKVVAKGVDFLALKIREVAKEHDIPLVENPPLAQALYATVDIDKEISSEHYKTVAEIISYVYRIKGKKK